LVQRCNGTTTAWLGYLELGSKCDLSMQISPLGG
jgi:hypothetical protein